MNKEIIYVLSEIAKAGYLTYPEYNDLAFQILQGNEMSSTSVECRPVYLSNMTLFQSMTAYLLTLDEDLEALIIIEKGNEYDVRLNGDIILSGKLTIQDNEI